MSHNRIATRAELTEIEHRLDAIERRGHGVPRDELWLMIGALIPDQVTAVVRQVVAEIVRRHEEEAHQGANAT